MLLLRLITLYIFYVLHQTTTKGKRSQQTSGLYIFYVLHQTTTKDINSFYNGTLYIFYVLHQTTTDRPRKHRPCGCISFMSYIKPQHTPTGPSLLPVVYLLCPTSNHNPTLLNLRLLRLYIFYVLHQTTTVRLTFHCLQWLYIFYVLHQTTTSFLERARALALYIFYVLHQTTTVLCPCFLSRCCISFMSYIKPQRHFHSYFYDVVVYLLCPTSNHNCRVEETRTSGVVYLLCPTSNHNATVNKKQRFLVVYLLCPTSNHNAVVVLVSSTVLYIFYVLHQTTTYYYRNDERRGLYIFYVLHQTTTGGRAVTA